MNRDGVLNLLARLHTYRDLVAEAYHQREIVRDEDNARAIALLQQHKVLVPRTTETFTLNTAFRRFLDASLNIERLYAQGAEIGAGFERLDKIADALFHAAHEGRTEDREVLVDEFHQSVYEIADGLATDLAQLRALVENQFATVTLAAEKRRQNAYYIGRTERLVKAIELFTLSGMDERITSDSAFVDVAPVFRSQLQERLPAFRQNLLGILAILQDYLFEIRQVEARTKRVRAIALFFARQPAFELHTWDEEANPPAWLHRAAGHPVRPWPSVREPRYSDDLASLASALPPPKLTVKSKRQRGTLVDESPPPTVTLTPKPFRRAISAMLAGCKASSEPISATAWHRANPAWVEGMSLSAWLQCVIEEAERPQARKLGLSLEVRERKDTVFDGNVRVLDVVLKASR